MDGVIRCKHHAEVTTVWPTRKNKIFGVALQKLNQRLGNSLGLIYSYHRWQTKKLCHTQVQHVSWPKANIVFQSETLEISGMHGWVRRFTIQTCLLFQFNRTTLWGARDSPF